MQRNAWLLTLQSRYTLAMAQQQVLEYRTGAEIQWVPQCNPNCQHVMIWRDHIVPVWGMPLHKAPQHPGNNLNLDHVLIASSRVHQTAQLIALSLLTAPVLIGVSDQDQCLPTETQAHYWKQSLLSCIEHQGSAVPIVDLAAVSQIHGSSKPRLPTG